MRPLPLLLAALIALGACATAGPAEGPTPQPTRTADAPATTATPPARETPPAEPATAPDALAMAPDHWWLKDAESDGVIGTSVERAYRELLAGKQPRRTVIGRRHRLRH